MKRILNENNLAFEASHYSQVEVRVNVLLGKQFLSTMPLFNAILRRRSSVSKPWFALILFLVSSLLGKSYVKWSYVRKTICIRDIPLCTVGFVGV